jgi:RNA recognition motif-containing protein
MSKTITSETNGWGAWRNSQKENEVLKSKLNEYHTKDNVRSLEDKSETELIKNMIIKKKNEIKQLILEAETKKHLLTEKIQKLNDEYKEYEKTNNQNIEKIMQKIALYKEMIDSDDEQEVVHIKLNTNKFTRKDTNEVKNELFVGSLKENIRDVELFELFKQYGQLERCRVLTTIVDGRLATKCCGFVRYKDSESALSAIRDLNGKFASISKLPLQLEYSKSNRKENDQDTFNQYNVLNNSGMC